MSLYAFICEIMCSYVFVLHPMCSYAILEDTPKKAVSCLAMALGLPNELFPFQAHSISLMQSVSPPL